MQHRCKINAWFRKGSTMKQNLASFASELCRSGLITSVGKCCRLSKGEAGPAAESLVVSSGSRSLGAIWPFPTAGEALVCLSFVLFFCERYIPMGAWRCPLSQGHGRSCLRGISALSAGEVVSGGAEHRD